MRIRLSRALAEAARAKSAPYACAYALLSSLAACSSTEAPAAAATEAALSRVGDAEPVCGPAGPPLREGAAPARSLVPPFCAESKASVTRLSIAFDESSLAK
jgi:hypothetical protein